VSYQAIYYRDRAGRMPVSDAIDRLGPNCQDSVDWQIGLLNDLSDARPHLGDPHSSGLKGERYRAFRELRCDCGKQHHRVIFRRSGRFFVLLHIILNKEGEIAEQDKKIALERWHDFIARMDAVPTAKPRPMGKDAP
jgi:hypothetical protein